MCVRMAKIASTVVGCWLYVKRKVKIGYKLSLVGLCLLSAVLLLVKTSFLPLEPAPAQIVPQDLPVTATHVISEIMNNVSTSSLTQLQERHEARTRHVQEMCAAQDGGWPGLSSFSWAYGRIELDKAERYVYCPVLKVSSTFFRRLLYPLSLGHKVTSPYRVPIKKALAAKRDVLEELLPLNATSTLSLLGNSTTIMFVREPFARLLSGYVDKLFAPNPYFWTHVGKHIVRKFRSAPAVKSLRYGHDVTFAEFVDYVIDSEVTNDLHRDAHFTPMYDTCKPCQLNYTVIGKLETFHADVFYMLGKLGHNVSQEEVESWSAEATDDAITDSITSPFSWRSLIRKCLSWSDALIRIWRKMQLRGIILFQQKFPWSVDEAERTVSARSFITAVQKCHAMADKVELQKQRLEVLGEAFSQISASQLLKLVDIFQPDFQLFGYNGHPDFIFHETFVQPLRQRNLIFNLSNV